MKRILLTIALVPLAMSMTSFSVVPEVSGQATLAQTSPENNSLNDQISDVLVTLTQRQTSVGISLDDDRDHEANLQIRYSMPSTDSESDTSIFDTPVVTSDRIVIGIIPTLNSELAASICNCATYNLRKQITMTPTYAELGIDKEKNYTNEEIRDLIVKFVAVENKSKIAQDINVLAQAKIAEIDETKQCKTQEDSELAKCLVDRAKDRDLSEEERDEALERLWEAMNEMFDADSPRKFRNALKKIKGNSELSEMRDKLERYLDVAEMNEEYEDMMRDYEDELRFLEMEMNNNDIIIASSEDYLNRYGYFRTWDQANRYYNAKMSQSELEYRFAEGRRQMSQFSYEHSSSIKMEIAAIGLDRSESRQLENTILGSNDTRISSRRGNNFEQNGMNSSRPGSSNWASRERQPLDDFLSGNRGMNRSDTWVPGTSNFDGYNSPLNNYSNYASRERRDYRSFLSSLQNQSYYQNGMHLGVGNDFNNDPRFQNGNYNNQMGMAGGSRGRVQ